jgi:hypothetical protein
VAAAAAAEATGVHWPFGGRTDRGVVEQAGARVEQAGARNCKPRVIASDTMRVLPSDRHFPVGPQRTSELEIGDLWTVKLPSGGYGCMQVTDVRRQGPGSRTSFIAGPLDWFGESPPLLSDVAGRRVLEIGLVRMEAFDQPCAAIFGNAEPVGAEGFDSTFDDGYVGAVTRVYGHLALPKIVERALTSAA